MKTQEHVEALRSSAGLPDDFVTFAVFQLFAEGVAADLEELDTELDAVDDEQAEIRRQLRALNGRLDSLDLDLEDDLEDFKIEVEERVRKLSHAVELDDVRLAAEIATLKHKVAALEQQVNQPGPAFKAQLTIGGSNMSGQITVDTTDETATLVFVDDKGNETSSPSGAQVEFTSDDESVATVAPGTSADVNAFVGQITPVGVGTANISATITDANGDPILEPDGVTPFTVDSQAVEVDPGAAVGARLTVAESTPSPTPDPAPAPDPAPTPDPSPAPDPAPTPDPSPAPDPAPTPDPTGGDQPTQAVYTYAGDPDQIDTTEWQTAPFTTSDTPPEQLYYFSGVGAIPAGDADWTEYTGTAVSEPLS